MKPFGGVSERVPTKRERERERLGDPFDAQNQRERERASVLQTKNLSRSTGCSDAQVIQE